MRIAEVIGRCTLSVCHPRLRGAKWVIGIPLAKDGLANVASGQHSLDGRGESFVIYDDRGAGDGELIAVSEGAEASAPFSPEMKPIDAYNAAILDHVEVD